MRSTGILRTWNDDRGFGFIAPTSGGAELFVHASAFLRDEESRVNTLVYDAVEKFGGSFSAEHGIGGLKVDKLEKHKSPVALGMMRAIKRGLDPQNIMNPGRVVRV